MVRRKRQDDLRRAISIIDQADPNNKGSSLKEQKRRRLETSENAPNSRKKPKRLTSGTSCDDNIFCISYERRIVKTKKLHVVDEECALQLTNFGMDGCMENRKLTQFIFHDAGGKPQPMEMLEVKLLYVSGLILPLEDNVDKGQETKVRCVGFGPIESWAISGFEDGKPIIWISTETADYECLEPASAYKNFHDSFSDKAHACTLVYKELSKTTKGNPNLRLNELLTRVASSMSGKFSQGVPIEGLILLWGEFIHNQLIGLDETASEDDPVFSKLPVLLSLRDASKRKADFVSAKVMPYQEVSYSKKSDQISEPAKANLEDENSKLARLMGEIETWLSFRKRKRQRSVTSPQSLSIKTNVHEIEKDYPPPAYYKAEIKETDEFVAFGSPCHARSTDQLPHRMLHNWSLYSTDSSFISLELLPMKNCSNSDVTVYGSGIMTTEDGRDFSLAADSNPFSSLGSINKYGTPLSLGAIKEWLIEFESSRVSISIRTNMAWYKLGKPSKQYASWYEPVLKTAKLAIGIITLLKEQRRVSRLPFQEVIKKVSEFGKDNATHISFDQEAVEAYMVVHGHIILQLFSNFPDDAIRKCAFVRTLQDRMRVRHYTKKLVRRKLILTKEMHMKSRAIDEATISKRKTISATTTGLINRIWRRGISDNWPKDLKEDCLLDLKEKNVKEKKGYEDYKSEEIEEQKLMSNKRVKNFHSASKQKKFRWSNVEIIWNGDAVGETSAGERLYNEAIVNGNVVTVGAVLIMETSEREKEPAMCIVEYMFEDSDARKMVHGRQLLKGFQTILGNFANKREVFLTNVCKEFELANVVETVNVEIRGLHQGYQHCADNAHSDSHTGKRRLPFEYVSKNLYWPEKGGIFSQKNDSIGLGNGHCNSCKLRESQNIKFFKLSSSMTGFTYQGVNYHIHDFLYLHPHQLAADKADRKTRRRGRNVGLKPYVVCQLLEVEVSNPLGEADAESVTIKVRRFFRPEDIAAEKAYSSDIREVYYSKQVIAVPVLAVLGKCEVRKKQHLQPADGPYISEHIFFCKHQYDTANGALKQLPSKIKFSTPKESSSRKAMSRKMKENCKGRKHESNNRKSEKIAPPTNSLAALDLFAGCGGLSEGLQQSGVSVTKWAIEFEEPAGKAFQLNHPEALTLINDSNVILRAVMLASGNADDCISTSRTVELAAKLRENEIDKLPRPGQVDFIYGGPPCQGFSKMNRFTESPWSQAQSELILNFLSYVDVFHPKFVLLENVRNFISFNKGKMFRFTLASLIEMGYQVRFGILEAGAYGVSQSRKRAFIWAASPGESLPEWPEPMHVFRGPELKVTLDKYVHYAAVRSTAAGAPFRAITVRDTIGDLPEVANGASASMMEYKSQPISWFQKRVRGDMAVLTDHISKEMSELNLTRCQGIPRRPGADWRNLPNKRIQLSNGRAADLVPRCVRNTAQRHNQWKGVFGRLDWEGHFPTTVTDPHPMHKVGMCFHPDQDRIITVRECARSQGFPDRYKFAGNILHKHKQIGNAVPPPLAFALGRKLKEALEGKSSM